MSWCSPHVSNNLNMQPFRAEDELLDQLLSPGIKKKKNHSEQITWSPCCSRVLHSRLSLSRPIMYLENKSNLEMEMSQTSAQSHQGRSSLRSPEAVAGNFGELRLLQDISESRDTQKLQQSAGLPAGQCVIHAEALVPVRQEDGYARLSSHPVLTSRSRRRRGSYGSREAKDELCLQLLQGE